MPEALSDSDSAVVLICDDNPANLAVLFEYLGQHGYRVLIAEDGDEAVRMAKQVRPDVILLDVMMPALDGFATCRTLKAEPAIRRIPVIFMTALSDTRDKLAGFEAGAVDYVTKPLQYEEVVARVRIHVGLYQRERRMRTKTLRLERELTRRVHTESELNEHVQSLENKNVELDAFARTVAHNLKSPLTGLIGFADLLAEESPLEGEPARWLEAIQANAQRMTDITEELLLLARLRAQDVERVPLDMGAIVTRCRDRLSPMIATREASLVLADTWPSALGHGPWVEEVWINYLSNALKYGGDPPHIELGASPCDDGLIRYWVRDNGQGIAEDAHETLFNEFTRLSQVKTQGYGLGLSIVKRIVDKLGGRVGVDSCSGQGSTFYFDLEAA